MKFLKISNSLRKKSIKYNSLEFLAADIRAIALFNGILDQYFVDINGLDASYEAFLQYLGNFLTISFSQAESLQHGSPKAHRLVDA